MMSLDHKLLNLSDKILEKHKKLGAGGFGQVFSSLYKSLPIAIKEIPIYKELEIKQIREIELLRKLRHYLIPRLIGIKLNDKLSIITELIPGMTLDKLLRKKKLSNLEKIVIVLDIITALEYLHSNKVIHRDLKPSNVMIDLKGNRIKLIDFGISKESSKELTTTQFSGSLIYMAPENFEVHSDLSNSLTDKPKMRISTKVDIWALGCLISEIFSGEKPWGKLGEYKIYSNLFQKVNFPIPESIENPMIYQIIKDCTKISTIDRTTITQVKEGFLEILFKHLQINQNELLEVKLDNCIFFYERVLKYLQVYYELEIKKLYFNNELLSKSNYYNDLFINTDNFFSDTDEIFFSTESVIRYTFKQEKETLREKISFEEFVDDVQRMIKKTRKEFLLNFMIKKEFRFNCNDCKFHRKERKLSAHLMGKDKNFYLDKDSYENMYNKLRNICIDNQFNLEFLSLRLSKEEKFINLEEFEGFFKKKKPNLTLDTNKRKVIVVSSNNPFDLIISQINQLIKLQSAWSSFEFIFVLLNISSSTQEYIKQKVLNIHEEANINISILTQSISELNSYKNEKLFEIDRKPNKQLITSFILNNELFILKRLKDLNSLQEYLELIKYQIDYINQLSPKANVKRIKERRVKLVSQLKQCVKAFKYDHKMQCIPKDFTFSLFFDKKNRIDSHNNELLKLPDVKFICRVDEGLKMLFLDFLKSLRDLSVVNVLHIDFKLINKSLEILNVLKTIILEANKNSLIFLPEKFTIKTNVKIINNAPPINLFKITYNHNDYSLEKLILFKFIQDSSYFLLNTNEKESEFKIKLIPWIKIGSKFVPFEKVFKVFPDATEDFTIIDFVKDKTNVFYLCRYPNSRFFKDLDCLEEFYEKNNGKANMVLNMLMFDNKKKLFEVFKSKTWKFFNIYVFSNGANNDRQNVYFNLLKLKSESKLMLVNNYGTIVYFDDYDKLNVFSTLESMVNSNKDNVPIFYKNFSLFRYKKFNFSLLNKKMLLYIVKNYYNLFEFYSLYEKMKKTSLVIRKTYQTINCEKILPTNTIQISLKFLMKNDEFLGLFKDIYYSLLIDYNQYLPMQLVKIKKRVLNTVKVSKKEFCSFCWKRISNIVFYCYWCNKYLCIQCVERFDEESVNNLKKLTYSIKKNKKNKDVYTHPHNLIYLYFEPNVEETRYIPLDYIGNNLFFEQIYNEKRDKYNHDAVCNFCSQMIENSVRFICLNCEIDKHHGFADFCNKCINTIKTENFLYAKEELAHLKGHRVSEHGYLRLKFSSGSYYYY